ncbi:MAG: YerC/YecD family TrpR-related protein [Ruminococcus sp.]|nr:YerC/YecD family TrpR-related protein [Ruminococcus sp.]
MNDDKLKDEALDNLFKAILCLETIDECYKFFEDLCTVLELKSLSQRLQVAKMLSEHHVYSDIVKQTGASTATISRVNRSLNYGSDGYDIVFKRLALKNGKPKTEINNNYYDNFSYYYDDLTKNVNYKKRASYFNNIIERFNGNTSGTLLDLACGTGSISEEMARLGYDVIGTDISEGMLNVAMNKKFNSGLDIQYLKQDMRKLNMFGTIDNILCVLDSLNHLPNLDDIKQTFSRVSLFAEPNGLFIFDMNTIYKHREILSNNSYIYETNNVFCAWENYYNQDSENNQVDIVLNFFEYQEDGSFHRYIEEFSEWAYNVDDILEILENVGFMLLAMYDDDTFNPIHESSERIVFVARKVR